MAIGPDLSNRAHMTINNQTSLRELKTFVDKMGGDQSLRATTNQHGETVIYVKDGKSSGVAKFFGLSRSRQNRAKQAVGQLLTRYQGKMEKGRDVENGMKAIFQKVADNQTLSSRHQLTSSNLKTLVNTAFAIYHKETGSNEKDFIPHKLAQQLGGNTHMLNTLSMALKKGTDSEETMSRKLGDALYDLFHEKLENDEFKGFVLNDTPQLRRDVLTAVQGQLDLLGIASSGKTYRMAESVIDNAVNKLCIRLMEPQVSDLNSIKVGEDTFGMTKMLAQGSFGTAFEYTDVEDSAKKIAVKVSNSDVGTDINDGQAIGNYSKTNLVEEFLRHKEVQGDGHPNILEVKSMFTTETGEVGIAMELAPHGDMYGLVQKLQTEPTDRKLPFVMTAFKDVVSGLKNMQDRGFVHGDLKNPNVFIGEGGHMKIADFGTAQGGGLQLNRGTVVDNPAYLSPEALRQQGALGKIDTKIVEIAEQNLKSNFKNVFEGQLHLDVAFDLLKEPIGKLVKKDARDELQTAKDQVKLDGKSDVWAAGTMLYELMTGNQIFKHQFSFAIAEKIEKFQSGLAIGEGSHFGSPSTGNVDVDRLINKMLDPDPSKRPSMEEVLNDPLLKGERVGTDQTREELVHYVSGTLDQYLDDGIKSDLEDASKIAGEFLFDEELNDSIKENFEESNRVAEQFLNQN